mgnify:CR=1 FL=1
MEQRIPKTIAFLKDGYTVNALFLKEVDKVIAIRTQVVAKLEKAQLPFHAEAIQKEVDDLAKARNKARDERDRMAEMLLEIGLTLKEINAK